MYYITSTMSSSVTYCKYDTSRKDMNVLLEQVTIKGKTGVRDKQTLYSLEGGTITPVSDQQFDWLKDDALFKLHQKNGFVKVSKSKSDAEKISEKTADTKDKSAQLTPKDFEERGLKKPKLSAEEVLTDISEAASTVSGK